jgi:hypothetical protein
MPQVLLFPYHREVDGVHVYSERAIPQQATSSLRTADRLAASSPLFRPGKASSAIFLTTGGWRWRLLSVGAGDAFALTRPFSEALIVNRSDVTTDRVWNGAAAAGERRLSSVIAHERTHTLIRRRFGLFADRIYPMWVREGYCDHVARSSTLSDAEAGSLRARNLQPPSLAYYDARRRVAAELERNGGSVEALFDSALKARQAGSAEDQA